MPNGDITPCSLLSYLLSTFKIGNIKQDLEKIEERLSIFHEEALKFIQELKSRNKICRKCKNRESCGGGCLALLLIQQERLICKFQPDLIIDNQNLDLQILKDFQTEAYNSQKFTKI